MLFRWLIKVLSWRVAEDYADDAQHRCRVFMSVSGPLQTLQRAELWGSLLVLQAFWPGHLGIDNLNVVQPIGRLLDWGLRFTPLPLVKDGDWISLIHHMIQAQGPDRSRVIPRMMRFGGAKLGLRISVVMIGRMILVTWVGDITCLGHGWEYSIVLQLHKS